MNKYDKELMRKIYFELGGDELILLKGIRTGYPRWVENLFYNKNKDYLQDWVNEKGWKLKSILWALMMEADSKYILEKLRENEDKQC